MRAALKSYLEMGKFTIANYHGQSNAGFILLGNIRLDRDMTPIDKFYFSELPKAFHESALFDRFHGFIEGWGLPRIREDLKIKGYALNVEYFTEILHSLRESSEYAIVVDELLEIPTRADTRDIHAIKKLTTAYLKLLFPHVKSLEDIDKLEFEIFCLNAALKMRAVIRKQLHLMDPEFREDLPDVRIK
jgi:ATP-dependent Lon protease